MSFPFLKEDENEEAPLVRSWQEFPIGDRVVQCGTLTLG